MALKQVEDAYSSRRIDASRVDERSKLKTIAGLIQNLTYREMSELGDLLNSEVRSESHNDFPAILLQISDKVLSK